MPENSDREHQQIQRLIAGDFGRMFGNVYLQGQPNREEIRVTSYLALYSRGGNRTQVVFAQIEEDGVTKATAVGRLQTYSLAPGQAEGMVVEAESVGPGDMSPIEIQEVIDEAAFNAAAKKVSRLELPVAFLTFYSVQGSRARKVAFWYSLAAPADSLLRIFKQRSA